MARADLVERLAELLGLPVEVVQAYGKPQRLVLFRAAPVVSGAKPPVRYATLKEQAKALASICSGIQPDRRCRRSRAT
jgi:hypothetical protein